MLELLAELVDAAVRLDVVVEEGLALLVDRYVESGEDGHHLTGDLVLVREADLEVVVGIGEADVLDDAEAGGTADLRLFDLLLLVVLALLDRAELAARGGVGERAEEGRARAVDCGCRWRGRCWCIRWVERDGLGGESGSSVDWCRRNRVVVATVVVGRNGRLLVALVALGRDLVYDCAVELVGFVFARKIKTGIAIV